jgi:putative ABC transport system permease protein
MFIALRDLAYARGRFFLMGLVVALVAFLLTFLSGLLGGLISNNVSGLMSLPITHVAFEYHDRPSFRGSLVERFMWEGWAAAPGVRRAEPLGHTTFNARGENDAPLELVLWGVVDDSVLVPPVTDGEGLGGLENGVVVSDLLVRRGVKIGDTITLDRVLTELKVVGVTEERNYEHVPIVYAPLRKWQEATYGPPGGAAPGETLPDVLYDYASAIALDLEPGAATAALDEELGTVTMTLEESYGTSPAYEVEIFTVGAIQLFLVFTAVVLIGAFFTIWTIQRTSEIGLVKALGASSGYLLRDALGQALVLLAAGIAAGVAAGVVVGILFQSMSEAEFPFILQPGPVASSALMLLVAGLLGGAVSVRLITSVDPIIALGRDR